MFCVTCILFWVALALVIFKLVFKLTTGWCRSNVCLVGKTVIVTGANSGIGYETAEDFAKRGAKVILACRDPSRGKNAAERIIKETDNKDVHAKVLDLSSFKSVREFSKEINATEKRLDVLVNNAGAAGLGNAKSEDGNLLIMQTNFFGPFLLTNLLLDLLKKTPNSRIVNVSSLAAKYIRSYDVKNLNDYPEQLRAVQSAIYARSKLCNILFTIELADRLKGTGVTTFSLHPGVVHTDLFKNMHPTLRWVVEQIFEIFFKSSIEGAQTSIHCSVAKGIESLSGEHFADCHPVKRYKTAQDPDAPKKLWKAAEAVCKIGNKNK